jgi:hypothetical protein
MDDMFASKDVRRAFLLAIGVALLTCVPYLVALRLPPDGTVFSGFLMNPLDGFSYLAKMRQGFAGAWSFELPYAPNPGPRSLVYVYYLLLGHIAAWTRLPLILVYHGARVLSAVLMFMVAFLLYRQALPNRRYTWAAYWLTLFGSGLGWIAIPFGVVASDLWIPESIPLLSAYVSAHFPLAIGAFLGAVLAMIGDGMTRRGRVLLALLCGFALGAVLPFGLITLVPVLLAWLIWERVVSWRQRESVDSQYSDRAIGFAALLLGAIPWLAYDLWLTRSHTVIGAWTSQNITPSPPPGEYLLGYGLLLFLAVVGLGRTRLIASSNGRLLVSWAGLTALAIYAPFGLQRRANLGLYFALAAMASYGIYGLTRGRVKAANITLLVLVLSAPSHLVVTAAGLSGVAKGEPLLVIPRGDLSAYEWLAENAQEGSLVLAGPMNGNRLPAYAPVRVLYGHPMETPQAEHQRGFVESLFAWVGSDQAAIDLLRDEGVDYVFFSPEEREFGAPGWIKRLPSVFSSGRADIFRVSTR